MGSLNPRRLLSRRLPAHCEAGLRRDDIGNAGDR
jgi:hypothetical protein